MPVACSADVTNPTKWIAVLASFSLSILFGRSPDVALRVKKNNKGVSTRLLHGTAALRFQK